MKQKIEVELNTRMVVPSPQASASEGEGEVKEDIEIGSSITEILAFLDDGKAYASAPEKRVPQSAQKGELCWYYALNRIRERHGKDARPNADRHVEQIISSYRKELTRAGTISLALNVFSKHFPADKPIGGVSVNHLDKYLQQAERLHPELKKYYALFIEVKTLCLTHAIESQKAAKTQAADGAFLQHLLQVTLADLPYFDEIQRRIKATGLDNAQLNYFEFIGHLGQLTALRQEEPTAQEFMNRMTILFAGIMDTALNSGKQGCSDDFTLNDAVEFCDGFSKVNAVKKLYNNLALKAELSFFEKILRIASEITSYSCAITEHPIMGVAL